MVAALAGSSSRAHSTGESSLDVVVVVAGDWGRGLLLPDGDGPTVRSIDQERLLLGNNRG